MEDILKETGKQVPALVVLVVLTWLYLKQQSEARKDYIGSIKAIHSENMEARSLSRDVMKENSLVGRQTNEALTTMTVAIKSLEGELNRSNGHQPK